jgi:two-component system, NarL family, response regulator DegU
MPETIKIAIADDHALFRRGMVSLLSSIPDFEIAFEAANGQELIDKLETQNVDMVMMDLKMPIMDGLQATEAIRLKWVNLPIVVISMIDEDHFVTKLLELGANGYLLKDADPEELELAIRTVVAEGIYYGPFLTRIMHRKLLDKSRKKDFDLTNNVHLTTRELEVIKLICEGLTTAQIAEKIYLSSRTVDGHRNSLMEKIGVKNTAGVVVYAVKNNLY